MTKERLAEIKRLCDAATPGPWVNYDHSRLISDETSDDVAEVHTCEDMEFISKSSTIIPELIAAYEKAVGLLEILQWIYNSEYDDCYCEICKQELYYGHAPDCELKKILEVE